MTNIEIDSGLNVIEILPLTQSQREQLADATEERVHEILNSIRQPANGVDAKAALALYEKHKIEGASLIACNLTLPAGTGIINCRVDGEHKQIRF